MPQQLEFAVCSKVPEISPRYVEAFCAWMQGKGWKTAKEITDEIGFDDRWIRLAVEHSNGRILSAPGLHGYRYFDREALPYADQAIAATRSQIRKMTRHLVALERRYHTFARERLC